MAKIFLDCLDEFFPTQIASARISLETYEGDTSLSAKVLGRSPAEVMREFMRSLPR